MYLDRQTRALSGLLQVRSLEVRRAEEVYVRHRQQLVDAQAELETLTERRRHLLRHSLLGVRSGPRGSVDCGELRRRSQAAAIVEDQLAQRRRWTTLQAASGSLREECQKARGRRDAVQRLWDRRRVAWQESETRREESEIADLVTAHRKLRRVRAIASL